MCLLWASCTSEHETEDADLEPDPFAGMRQRTDASARFPTAAAAGDTPGADAVVGDEAADAGDGGAAATGGAGGTGQDATTQDAGGPDTGAPDAGPPCPQCDDGVACTRNRCDADGVCVYEPRDAFCDDGLYCTGAERCDVVDGCVDVPLDLGDGIDCTQDSCDEAGERIVHARDHSSCSNGIFCDGEERCDPVDDCGPGTPPACSGSTPYCDENRDRCAGGRILVGAGDIVDCADPGPARYTAELVSSILAAEPRVTVFALGDNVYRAGTAENYANCYEPSWGAFRNVTRPIIGNHDYGYGTLAYDFYNSDGFAYRDYFTAEIGTNGANSGTEGSYYSYNLGSAWHVVVVDSQCTKIAGFQGCAYSVPGAVSNSVQADWLVADLSANQRPCVAVMWHHPRWSSGRHGDNDLWVQDGGNSPMDPMWRIIVDQGVDLLLSGHDHNYERFRPLDGDGNVSVSDGVRQFVVGTGGRYLYPRITNRPISAVYDNENFGVLKLVLMADSYSWEFIGGGVQPGDSSSVLDAGWAACH